MLNDYGVVLAKLGRDADATLAFKSAMLLDPTLKVALSNTYASVQSQLTGADKPAKAWTRYLFWTLFVFVCPPAWILFPVVYLVRLTTARLREDKRSAELAKVDPELHRIWQQLEQDRQSGRLGS